MTTLYGSHSLLSSSPIDFSFVSVTLRPICLQLFFTLGCQEIDPDAWNVSASSSSDHYIPESSRFDSRTAWCEDPKSTGGYLQIKLPFVYNSMCDIAVIDLMIINDGRGRGREGRERRNKEGTKEKRKEQKEEGRIKERRE